MSLQEPWPEGVGRLELGEVGSTQDEARRLAGAGERGPLWITARLQTAGRGRRGRSWSSPPGNLAATLLLTPALPLSRAAELSFLAALAVLRMLKSYRPAGALAVKWPNDVLLAGRKVAGILLETLATGRELVPLAIGIGVNLASHPEDAERPATHLGLALDHAPPSPSEALAALARAMAELLALHEAAGFAGVRAEWLAHAAGLGETITARLAHCSLQGRFLGIDEEGALLLSEPGRPAPTRIAAGDVYLHEGGGQGAMLLAIDAGNTNTVFGLFSGERLLAEWRAATDPQRTADEYAVWLSMLMGIEGIKREEVGAVVVATVVPQALFALRQLSERFFRVRPVVVGDPGIELGLKVNVRRPEAVGADRLVNALSAHKSYPGALIIVDFGTATTFDVVSEGGDYEGGVIAPGINLSLEALHRAAAQLPRIAIEKPADDAVIGKDTVPAMLSGIYWGYLGLIEGLIARIKAAYGRPMTVIATGGLAPLFRDATAAIEHIDQDLTMRGLLEVHRLNAAGAGARG